MGDTEMKLEVARIEFNRPNTVRDKMIVKRRKNDKMNEEERALHITHRLPHPVASALLQKLFEFARWHIDLSKLRSVPSALALLLTSLSPAFAFCPHTGKSPRISKWDF